MSEAHIHRFAAWGQYLHWAHLQFERYTAVEEDASASSRTGAAAHWLAAEYVVLEGWRELGFSGGAVSRLLDLYPEHCDTLRRCRNAVYHFQANLIDPRITKCLLNEAEELTWSIALHEEFQRSLVAYPYLHSGTFDEQADLADELAACIGWFPEHTLTGGQFRIIRKCLKFEQLLQDDRSSRANEGRALVKTTVNRTVALNFDNHLTALKRWTSGEATGGA